MSMFCGYTLPTGSGWLRSGAKNWATPDPGRDVGRDHFGRLCVWMDGVEEMHTIVWSEVRQIENPGSRFLESAQVFWEIVGGVIEGANLGMFRHTHEENTCAMRLEITDAGIKARPVFGREHSREPHSLQ